MKQFLLVTSIMIIIAVGLSACSDGTATNANAVPRLRATAVPPTLVPTVTPAVELLPGISGIGEVRAERDADLVFIVPGMVAEVNVKEGDLVTKGQLLGSLDTRTFDQQILQAEAAVASAKAQESVFDEPPRAMDAKAARAAVQQAQAMLDQVLAGPKSQDRQSVQAGLTAAEASLQSTRDRLSFAKTQAEAQVQQAAQMLTQAQARYAQAKYNWEYARETGNDPIVPRVLDPATGMQKDNKLSDGQLENYQAQFVQAEAALRQAEKNVEQSLVAAESARQAEIIGIQAAEQQVVQAHAVVEKLNLPPDKSSVAAARAALAQAQAAQARLIPNPTKAQRAMVSAAIAQAEAALELARINREHAELRAPFDGIVSIINIDPGDLGASAGRPAIQMVDISKLHIDVQISDGDIARVKIGQQAEVHAEALLEQTIKGKVSYIAPTATVIGNIRSYRVRIDFDGQQGLRAGMSVRVEIKTS